MLLNKGSHLCYHESGVDATICHQERWQLRHIFVHHQSDATLADGTNFSDGQGLEKRLELLRAGVHQLHYFLGEEIYQVWGKMT